MIVLKSQDDRVFHIERAVAEKSVLLKNMLEDVGETDEAIPLPNVNGRTLEKVLEFCKHHKDDPPTEEGSDRDEHGKKRADDIEEWDSQFISVVDNEQLFDIILAANYMDIKPLLELGCKSVANMIKGKSPQEIRHLFNIENDFTPEEEEQIRRENEWAADA